MFSKNHNSDIIFKIGLCRLVHLGYWPGQKILLILDKKGLCPSEERVVNDSISCDLPTNSDDGPSDINNTDRTYEDTNSPEGNRTNEDTNSPEGNNDPTTPVRRSTRNVSLPKMLNDFVIEGKVRYGLEKVVNYSNLSIENQCFATILNKTVEPQRNGSSK
uniref:Uncharacterized protein n=1 Tax=Helianthus annuus TaxID=4232 RepID=A0A251V1H6_HELAN